MRGRQSDGRAVHRARNVQFWLISLGMACLVAVEEDANNELSRQQKMCGFLLLGMGVAQESAPDFVILRRAARWRHGGGDC